MALVAVEAFHALTGYHNSSDDTKIDDDVAKHEMLDIAKNNNDDQKKQHQQIAKYNDIDQKGNEVDDEFDSTEEGNEKVL